MGNLGCTYKMGDERLESSPVERYLGVDGKLNMSKQCALAPRRANHVLGYVKHSVVSQSRKVIVPLHMALELLHLCAVLGISI